MFNHSADVSTILITFILLSFFTFLFKTTTLLFWTSKWINTHANTPDFINRVYNDYKSNLEAEIWSWTISYDIFKEAKM